MKVKYFNIIWSLVSVAILTVSCGGSAGNDGGAPGGGQSAQPYPVLNLQPRAITLTNSYPANMQGYQTVEIRPRVSANITKMLVDEGARVHKGQTLFQLDDRQYRQQVRSAKADVQSAKSGVQSARDEVERLKPLVKQDIISNYRLQSAKDNLQSQKAALAKARANLQNARVNLEYTSVKSPATGAIGNIPYRVGSLVGPNIQKPLTTVSDISKMYAYFSLSERELLQMTQSVAKEGGKANLHQRVQEMPPARLILPDSSVYDHKGKIELSSGLLGQGTGSASFRAVFPNPNRILRSGGSGTVQIPYYLDSVIVIPKAATHEIQNKKFVYIVTDSNTVSSEVIQTRPLSTPKLYVVKNGLNRNDKIVTAGTQNLRDNAKIKPRSVDADSLYEALTVQKQQKADSASGGRGK